MQGSQPRCSRQVEKSNVNVGLGQAISAVYLALKCFAMLLLLYKALTVSLNLLRLLLRWSTSCELFTDP